MTLNKKPIIIYVIVVFNMIIVNLKLLDIIITLLTLYNYDFYYLNINRD